MVLQDKESHVTRSLLAAIVEGSNDAIIAKTLDGRVLSWNSGATRIFGYSADEMIGQPITRIIPPALQHEENDILDRVRRGERVEHFETVRLGKGGGEVEVSVTVSPVRDENGRIVAASKTVRDVTERNARERELLASGERFRILAGATTDAIWDSNLDSDTVWWSEGLRRLFGHDPKGPSVNTAFWTNRIHGDDRRRVLEGMAACLAGSDNTWSDTYRFSRADGSIANVADHGFVIRNDSGRAVRMVGGMSDITERLQTEERLRQSQKMEAVGNLTGGLAHDFNNLLGVIIGNIDLLRERIADPEAEAIADSALSAALRGADLTKRLLAFARRQPLQPQQIDVNELVARVSKMMSRMLGENIEIKDQLGTGTWPVVADPAELEACLINITTNARDAMPDGGELLITTSNRILDDDYVALHPGAVAGEFTQIEVTDTGTGMSEETLKQVFEPFFTTKEEGRGTGLGLSMVFGFIKQSGGHVSVYSELGVGSTFRLYVPRATLAQPIEQSIAVTVAAGSGETVLVVEDNAGLRELVVRQVKELGYTCLKAVDGRAAIRVLEDRDVDLVFTDVIMPGGVGGYELANIVRARWPKVKLLLTSGFPEEKARRGERGADLQLRLLSKPYRKEELASAIQEALGRPPNAG